MTPLEALTAARERISTPERWTQGAEARDAEGNSVEPWGAKAVRWCMIGAIQHVSLIIIFRPFTLLVRAIGDPLADIAEWQDNPERTHTDVLATFDRAIELARAEQ